MELTLIRQTFYEECTHGILMVNGEKFCDTLEPHRIDFEHEQKQSGVTAIPEGRYKVVMGWSNRYQDFMPQICDVPHFSGILIHGGNQAKDTAGCVLVGQYCRRNFIAHSLRAFAVLRAALADAYNAKEAIYIEVK